MNNLVTDIELIIKLQEGDANAFDLIYSKYSGKIYLFGLKYLRSTSEAEELVQSVFMKIWENRKGLIEELSFKSYLFTIAYNDICKFYRKQNYQKQFIEEALYENAHSSTQTEDSIDYKSLLNRIESLIDTLPERQKTIFRKSRLEGMATKDIAGELKLSPGTIDNYISEALKFLREKIRKEDILLIQLFIILVH